MKKLILPFSALFFGFVLLSPQISSAQATTGIQAQINALTAELQQLESQLTAQGGSNAFCYTFTANLSIGQSGAAVTALQTALQKDGESVAVTGTFDDQTASAVTGFQEKYAGQILTPNGLQYGTGYAGPATRAELNSLYGCGGATATPPIVSTSTSASTSTTPAYPLGCTSPFGYSPLTGVACTPTITASSTSTVGVCEYANPPQGCSWQGGGAYPACGAQLTCNNSPATTTTVSSATLIINGNVPLGMVGQSYQANFSASGSFNSSNVVTMSASGAPAGLQFMVNGGCSGVTAPYACDPATVQSLSLSGTPTQSGTFTLTVMANDATVSQSVTKNFTLVVNQAQVAAQPPSISSLSPAFGPIGTNVTISGSGFASTGNAVQFGDYDFPNVSSVGGTTLAFTVPSQVFNPSNASCSGTCPNDPMVTAGNFNVSVSNSDGNSNVLTFAVTAAACQPVSCANPPAGCAYVGGGACVNGFVSCGTLACGSDSAATPLMSGQ